MTSPDILVVGAGVFGLTAALALRERGHAVTVLDPGPIPHPLAASTDISKVVRMEYGRDEAYMALMEEAITGWHEWNARFARDREPLYHETGVLMLSREPMAPGGYEYESWSMLRRRGHSPERLDADEISRRFPAWRPGRWVDGFYHAKGGFAESGRVVGTLLRHARARGVRVIEGWRVRGLREAGGRVVGVESDDGRTSEAGGVVVAAGAWTGTLLGGDLPIRATGHPVFHLRPRDPAPFRAAPFPTFTAAVARTGYYGFPVSREGVVKIANHGLGRTLHPDARRSLSSEDHERLASFLADTLPGLVDAPVTYTRLCLYADTQDEDFWIAGDPDRPGLTVASGGSGHGFKFAPVLGELVANAVEGRDDPRLAKFRWRPEVVLEHGNEAARCHDPSTRG